MLHHVRHVGASSFGLLAAQLKCQKVLLTMMKQNRIKSRKEAEEEEKEEAEEVE